VLFFIEPSTRRAEIAAIAIYRQWTLDGFNSVQTQLAPARGALRDSS